jgi:hypothetical protein
MSVRRMVLAKFKEHGLMIQADACATLVAVLEEENVNVEENIQYILGEQIVQSNGSERVVVHAYCTVCLSVYLSIPK